MTWPDLTPLAGAAAGVVLPAGIGSAALTALAGRGLLRRDERLGLAYPLGMTLVTSALYVLGRAGVPFTRATFALIGGGLLLLCHALAHVRPRGAPPRSPSPVSVQPGWVLCAALTLPALGVLLFAAFELLHRPVSAPDSFTVWALRAKVWTANAGLHLNPDDAFYLGGAVRPDYPPHVSLLQTWAAIWFGRWSDVAVNLPWACYAAGLVLFLYGMIARRCGRRWALVAACLLATTPLVVVHTAIAGYADIVLAVHFAAAALAVYLWAEERAPGYLLVAAAFTVSLPLVKLEGIPLAVACTGAAGMQAGRSGWRTRYRWLLLSAVLLAAIVAAWANPAVLDLLASSGWHGEALSPLLYSVAESGNFCFLWPLFTVLSLATLRANWGRPLGWLVATVTAAAVPFFYVFACTYAARFAALQTAPGRLFLALAPAALAAVVLMLAQGTAASARRIRPGRALALAVLLVLAAGVLASPMAMRGDAVAQWALPSTVWRPDPAAAVYRYVGPPIALRGSPGLTLALQPGIDSGMLHLAWRRADDPRDSHRVALLRRTRPRLALDLSPAGTWSGELSGLAFRVAPGMLRCIRFITVEAPGLRARLQREWKQFLTPEIFELSIINVVEGAQWGSLHLSQAAAALWTAIFLAAAAAAKLRRRQLPWHVVAAAAIVIWALCAVRFGWDLLATYEVDGARFRGGTAAARMDTIDTEFRALVAAVTKTLPPGASVLFVSQFDIYHDRAQYALYPRRVVNWLRPRPEAPDYLVLFHPAPNSPELQHRHGHVLARLSATALIARLDRSSD